MSEASNDPWLIDGDASEAIYKAARQYDRQLLAAALKIATERNRRSYSGQRLIALDDVKAAILIIQTGANNP